MRKLKSRRKFKVGDIVTWSFRNDSFTVTRVLETGLEVCGHYLVSWDRNVRHTDIRPEEDM